MKRDIYHNNIKGISTYHMLITLLIVFSMLLIVVQASAQTYDYWPNPVSHTNSDDWLREPNCSKARFKVDRVALEMNEGCGMKL